MHDSLKIKRGIKHDFSKVLREVLIITDPKFNRDYIKLADSRPINRPIKYQIRSTKKNTLLYFFSIGRQFLGFGNRPIVGRSAANFIFEMSPLSSADVSADRRPTQRQSANVAD